MHNCYMVLRHSPRQHCSTQMILRSNRLVCQLSSLRFLQLWRMCNSMPLEATPSSDQQDSRSQLSHHHNNSGSGASAGHIDFVLYV